MWKVGVGGLLILAGACGQSVKDDDDTGAGGSSAHAGSENGGSTMGGTSSGGSTTGGASSGGSTTGGASSGGSSMGGAGSGGTSGSGAMGGVAVSGTGPGGAGAGAVGGAAGSSGDGGGGGATSGAGGSSAGVGGSAGNAMAGSGGSSEPPLAMNVQACEIIGGLNRVRFAGTVQSAGVLFCVHVALVQPGTAPDGLVLPQGWGLEFAAGWGAPRESCLIVEAGEVPAMSVVGEVSFVAGGTIDTLDADVTLTFGFGDAPRNARFLAEDVEVQGSCN